MYFLPTKSMIKKLKHKLYIKQLLIWICKGADPDEYEYSSYGIEFDSIKPLFTDGTMENISLFLKLICVHLCILVIREKIP